MQIRVKPEHINWQKTQCEYDITSLEKAISKSILPKDHFDIYINNNNNTPDSIRLIIRFAAKLS